MNLRRLWNTWWKKVLWILIGLLIALLVSAGLWVKYVFMPHLLNPWLPPQMQFAQPSFRSVVGDLGGMPVTIPRHFAEYVEYEGDPGWGEKRRGDRPQRTHASRLKSFGFDVRYPDMAGKDSPEMLADKQRQTIRNTMWLDVGITTGASYPKDGFLDRLSSHIMTDQRRYPYELLPQAFHGLTVYSPTGVDPDTRRPFKTHHEDNDLFLARNDAGHVTTYIECANVEIPSAPCRHTFSLEPAVGAQIRVGYRRGLLPEWASIQRQVTQLILGWRVPAATVSEGGRTPSP